MSNFNLFFLIVAAGEGLRMQSQVKKQYIAVNNLPILSHTLLKFEQYKNRAHKTILVVPSNDIEYCRKNILNPLGINDKIMITAGGKQRQDSVLKGLNVIRTLSGNLEKDVVLIHDGVRPLINNFLIDACITGAIEFGACVPAIKAIDTLKIVKDKVVKKTLNRESVYQIQTPQAFLLKIIINAMESAKDQNFSGTDDASFVEFCGHNVAVIEGLRRNIKITTLEDIKFAKAYLDF